MALPQEGRAIFGSRGWELREYLAIKRRTQKDKETTIFITGQGREKINNSLKKILSTSNFSIFINIGVCGGLRGDLLTGDIISPEEIIFQEKALKIDKKIKKRLDRALLKNGFKVNSGRLLTSIDIVFDPEDKSRLYREKNCLAVDMESFFIGQTLKDLASPFYCLKAISDTADHPISKEIVSCLKEDGNVDYLSLLRLIFFHPTQLSSLVKMGVGFKRATSSLRRAFYIVEAAL